MEAKNFFKLSIEEKKLRSQMKDLIVESLKGNGGRITFTPENEDDEYPVCATLWGKHDSENIEISDVYLDEQDEIYADGYEQSTGILEKNFTIYSEQYWDVVHFIAAVLEWKQEVEAGTAEPDPFAFEITVLFGSDLIREYSDTGEIPSEGWISNNGGVVETKSFNSKPELDAYIEGLNDADGWLDSLVLDPFMVNLLKEKRETGY